MFEQVRSGGGKASHGKIAFELASRTLTIEDIVIEPKQQALAKVEITSFVAVGVQQADPASFSADTVEVSGLNLAIVDADRVKVKATYKIPQVTARNYSGPIRAAKGPQSDSLVDMYRFVLEQYAGISASSIVAPTLTATVDAGAGKPGSGELRLFGPGDPEPQSRQGRIRSRADRATFTLDVSPKGRLEKMTGELAGLIAHDFDASAIAAALDPQQAKDDNFHRLYRRISAGS